MRKSEKTSIRICDERDARRATPGARKAGKSKAFVFRIMSKGVRTKFLARPLLMETDLLERARMFVIVESSMVKVKLPEDVGIPVIAPVESASCTPVGN